MVSLVEISGFIAISCGQIRLDKIIDSYRMTHTVWLIPYDSYGITIKNLFQACDTSSKETRSDTMGLFLLDCWYCFFGSKAAGKMSKVKKPER